MRRATWIFVLLAACAGTSAGNPVDGSGGGAAGEGGGNGTAAGTGLCDAKSTALASLDAKSPLGFSAADLLSAAGGSHDTSIRWQPSDFVSYAPESGTQGLHLTITPKADPKPRFVSYTQSMSSGGAEPAIAGPSCESMNAVELDVTVKVTSDGGALDEQVDGTLRASGDQYATLHLVVKAGMLGGGFHVLSTKPAGFQLTELQIDLGISPLGLRGSLSGIFEMQTANTATTVGGGSGTGSAAASAGLLARIGAEGCDDNGGLPIAIDRALQGFSGQDAVDLVNALPTLDGTWQDGAGARVSLQVEPGNGPVCASLDPSAQWIDASVPGTLWLHAKLHASTDDGRLDAMWPVTLAAVPDADGALQSVVIGLDGAALDQATAGNLESVYGIHGVDASSYDSVQVTLSLQVTPGDPAPSATGMLQVSGFTLADCAKNPAPTPPPDASAGSSPGCAGATITPLSSLDF
jgi:hypothetical protein